MESSGSSISRREFVKNTASSLAVLSLFEFCLIRNAFSATAKPEIVKWLNEMNQLARAVGNHDVTPLQWQHSMEQLLGRIDLPAFLKLIDFETLISRANLPDKGESFEKFAFKNARGLPSEFKFYRNLAGLRKGRSIPPHGHNNLVSSFLVLKGELHGRHFDRIRMEGGGLMIRPSLDHAFKTGEFSTVSDERDNVHWFTAQTDGSFIFDFGIDHIQLHWRPKGMTDQEYAEWRKDAASGMAAKSSRIYLDMNKREAAAEGAYKVARLSHEDAYRLYG